MNMMDKNLMKAAFPLLANLLADELGIKVVWQAGVPPHADRSRNLIVLPPDIDPIAALGILIHEAGHFMFTNFGEWNVRVANDKTRHAFGNAIEDIWMERAVMQKYPGARKRLNDVIISLQADGRIKNGRHPVIDYFHTKLRAVHLQQSVDSDLLKEAEEIFITTFSDEKKIELDVVLEKIVNVNSTKQAFDLSEEVMALFDSDDESESGESESGESGEGESESGESGEGESESGESGEGESGEGESGEGESESGESGEGESESGESGEGESGKGESGKGESGKGESGKGESGEGESGEGESGEGESGEGESGEGESGEGSTGGQGGANKGAAEGYEFEGIGEMLAEAVEEAMKQAAANGSQGQYQGGCSKADLQYEGEFYDADVTFDTRYAPKVLAPAETSHLRRGLSALLQGETLVKQRSSLAGNKIVPQKLWSVKYGGKAFKTVTQGVKRNASIHLSLDVSGSMCGIPIQVAKKAVLSVASAVEKTAGVDVVVSTFGSSINVLKTPSAIQGISAGGGTAMAPAIKVAGMQLARSIKDKKILIVVTDGAPHQPAWTRLMIEACQAIGITVVGVGIGDMAVKDLFENHIVIQDVSDLPKTLLGCLKNIL